MRLYVPNKGSSDKMEEDDNISDRSGRSNEDKTSAEQLKEVLSKHTNIGSVSDSIAHLSDVQMITPRGKFDLYFIKNYIKIRGPSVNYKINHKNINKVFLLPKPDGHHVFFVVGLNNPVKQGNTSYPFFVFHIKNKNERTINLNLPEDEEERKEILKNPSITETYTGELIDIMAKLFQSLVGIGVIIPGKTFKSSTGTYAVKCSIKASEGLLYPLERSLVFVNKPVLSINLEDIRHAQFTRVLESNAPQRSFDMTIATKKEEFQFIGIEKVEYENLINYFTNKKIKIINKDERNNVVDIKQAVSLCN